MMSSTSSFAFDNFSSAILFVSSRDTFLVTAITLRVCVLIKIKCRFVLPNHLNVGIRQGSGAGRDHSSELLLQQLID